jgi:hypothetical protein
VRKSPNHARAIPVGRTCVLVAVLIVVVATAVATGSVQRRKETVISAQTAGSVTAKCKRGQSALAGGFATRAFEPTDEAGPVTRFTSRPVGKRAVKARAFNFGETDPGTLDSFAYCGKRARPPKIRSNRVQIAPTESDSVIARCPRGSKAIAGGFGTNPFSKDQGPEILTLTSKRAGKRAWKVAGFNIGEGSPSGPGWLTAYAYCKTPGPEVAKRSKQAKVPANGIRTLDVKCPNHRKALSGGFDGHYRTSPQRQPQAAAAISSKRLGHRRGWRTVALGVSEPPDQGTITAYVYCRR